MANKEQLKILKQGVEAWNQWREDNPYKRPDLKGANLEMMDLTGMDLERVDLTEAKLWMASITGGDLLEAYLGEADLRETDLRGSDLGGANLIGAKLVEADLRGADLRETILIQVDLSKANITGAKLYGTARDDWIIDGIKCNYVYWDIEGKERTPKDRDFRPGEFEELYKSLPTFEYYFEHGFTAIDAVVMDRVVQAINERRPEFELKLDSFHSRGQPHAVFTVLHKESIEEVKSQVTTDYERRIAALEGKQEQMMTMFSALLSRAELLPAPAAEENPERKALKEELRKVTRKLNDTLPGSVKEQALLQEIEILNNKLQVNN